VALTSEVAGGGQAGQASPDHHDAAHVSDPARRSDGLAESVR
jgi:hypothetical protein